MDEAEEAEIAALNARCAANPREAANYAARLRRTPRAEKETWLWNSAYLNHVALARLLLADGVSPHTTFAMFHNATPLHAAARYGASDVVRLLLEAGADANSVINEGSTPLQTAIRGHSGSGGHLACVRELIPHTDLQHFNAGGLNVLHGSIMINQPEISSCCCHTSRTTSTCAPSRNALRVTRTIRTTTRHPFCAALDTSCNQHSRLARPESSTPSVVVRLDATSLAPRSLRKPVSRNSLALRSLCLCAFLCHSARALSRFWTSTACASTLCVSGRPVVLYARPGARCSSLRCGRRLHWLN